MKKNELIAEFMGVGKHYEAQSSNQFNQYHTSWDRLMPVVKKCFCTGDNTFEWDAIMDAICTCDIKIVHSVVVEFIKDCEKKSLIDSLDS